MSILAQAGDNVVIVAVGADGSLSTYWGYLPDLDVLVWDTQQLPTSSSIFAASIANVGGSPMVAAADENGALWSYWQGSGPEPWHVAAVLPGFTAGPPQIAQVGDAAVIVTGQIFEGVTFFWQAIGTTPWNGETVTGTDGPVPSRSVAQVGDSSVIVFAGFNGVLSFYWQTIGTVPWNPEAVPVSVPVAWRPSFNSAGSTVSVAQVGDASVIAAVGQDGSLWFFWQAIGAAGWNPPQQVPAPAPISSVSVAQVGESSVIAAVGQDGGLWFFWQGIGDADWSPPQTVPAPVPISSASVTQVGNASGIAAIGQDGSLWFFWQIIGTEPWETHKVASAGSVSAGL